jgi:hypothetical protein
MSDVSPYGVTQNADAARVTANALVGTRAGAQIENAAFGSAAGFSTAPYIPPRSQREGFCRGKNDTCMARPIRGTELCMFHSPGQARRDRLGDG